MSSFDEIDKIVKEAEVKDDDEAYRLDSVSIFKQFPLIAYTDASQARKPNEKTTDAMIEFVRINDYLKTGSELEKIHAVKFLAWLLRIDLKDIEKNWNKINISGKTRE